MRHLLWGIFAVFLAFPAIAECLGDNLLDQLSATERAELNSKAAKHPYPTGNIWRAEKPGSVVNIIGTFHLYDPRTHDLIEVAQDLIEVADRAFFEVLPEDELRMQAILAEQLDLGFITDGPTLPELLAKDEWAELKSRMLEYGMPGFFVAKMKPWFIGLTLAYPACAIEGGNIDNGLDTVLMKIADAAGTPTQALDNTEELLTLLSKGSMEEQIADLKVALAMTTDYASQHITTLDLYLDGKHRELIEFSLMWSIKTNPEYRDKILDGFSELEADLIDDRNLKWMDILLPVIDEGNYVVAVGAGHLSGEFGLLNLLDKGGYTLTPIEY